MQNENEPSGERGFILESASRVNQFSYFAQSASLDRASANRAFSFGIGSLS
jgi:hypothetical protein